MVLRFSTALMFSWLWTLTFVNRVNIYRDREKYRPETYLVTGAEFSHDDETGNSWWLTGTVAGREERFIPRLHGPPWPKSSGDLLALYPKGSKVEVFYNQDATETIMQNETLRVLTATPDFWQREAALRHRLALRVLVPVPVALVIYLIVRYLNRRHAKMKIQPIGR